MFEAWYVFSREIFGIPNHPDKDRVDRRRQGLVRGIDVLGQRAIRKLDSDLVFDKIENALQKVVAFSLDSIGQPHFEIQEFPFDTESCYVERKLCVVVTE